MAVTIGSNIASMKVLRRLDTSTQSLGRTFERLGSGLRINRASDDPAGLAISSELNAKSRILNRARQNLNDATSVLSIADGTLESFSNLVIRMSELAEQAANGSMTNTQRAGLSSEYEQLDFEIRRLSKVTSFNGLNLLEGGKSTTSGAIITSDPTSAANIAVSADGRFRAFSNLTTAVVFDTVTNSQRNITIAGGNGASKVKVLANGDTVFQATNAANTASDIYYYDYAAGTTRKLTDSQTSTDLGTSR